MISGVRSMILDELGIVAAIEYLAAELATPPVRFQHRLTTTRFAALVEEAIFRICQEVITNARRHSGASEIFIKLEEQDGLVQLHVEDNGCGFDPAAIRLRTFGLEGVGQRARLLGGQATIDSAPGYGTGIHVELPAKVRRSNDLAGHAYAAPWQHQATNGSGQGTASRLCCRYHLLQPRAVARLPAGATRIPKATASVPAQTSPAPLLAARSQATGKPNDRR